MRWKFFFPLRFSSMNRSMRGIEASDSLPPETPSAPEAGVAANAAAYSGQSLADIAPLVDRVYVRADGDQSKLELLRTRLAAADESTELVRVLAGPGEPDGGESYLIAP